MYGAALGDPHRFANADARTGSLASPRLCTSQLVDCLGNAHISKVGSVELRDAIIWLGNAVALHHPDFAAYRRHLVETRGKKKMVPARHDHRGGSQPDVTDSAPAS